MALGLGVHTGHVVVSMPEDASAHAQTFVREVLLLADYLAQHAMVETLLVSAATAALVRHLAHMMASHGQVVGIVGAHGLGKSRLLYEFCHSLAAHPVTDSALHETVRILCP